MELSFLCETASIKLQPSPVRFEIHIESIYRKSRASIENRKKIMSTIIQASPLEKMSREPLPTGDSCVLVIFGASGDLTNRKLIPGLYNLACVGCMNPEFEVLGIGRTPMSSEEFRKKTGVAAAKSKDTRDFSPSGWTDFETRLHYMVGDINDPKWYAQLRVRLEEMERSGSSPNHLFYVSTPASVAAPIIEGLGAVGLNRREKGWTRIVLEKPFGRDLESARALNDAVRSVFDEKTVYRIDHYLGKETVQNILVFRFSNSLFEPVWNRNYIDYVEITAAERVGIRKPRGVLRRDRRPARYGGEPSASVAGADGDGTAGSV